MGALARLCVILAAVGALNWAAFWFLGKDGATMLLGVERKVGSDALRIVIALAAIYALLAALGLIGGKPKKS